MKITKEAIEIAAITGITILGGIALMKGQAEIAAAAVGAIAGYIAHGRLSNSET